jgi:DHA3 family macrolide efflux protein-like MFS transporter
MRAILQKKALRYVFGANMISMLGSGMNSAAVAWYILQATHSEIALGTFAVLQTLPAMLMLPFTGVLIDREDRRRLVMWLDAIRAVIILAVAILSFTGKVRVWQLYVMNTLVAAGFWMFWPTITALIQELTPGEEFIHANTFLLAGIQGGWLIAGSIVGFVYNHIGLGGVLLIDFSTYLVSFLQGTSCGAASGRVTRRSRGRGNRGRTFRPRDARRAAISSRPSSGGHAGNQLGAFSGRDDDGRRGHCSP